MLSRIRTNDKFNQKHKFNRYLLTFNAVGGFSRLQDISGVLQQLEVLRRRQLIKKPS